ncbi:tripartite tricarboxylate transporter TctB family protein [Methylorubrum salsuginis]|uniref:Tripartite tricarboxylate transporter TctB family protein n=1 Tax=Methylorubrum salsuginis TaxID=414703 RepID=A0A1I4G9P9_9HYPH|nr:tripartite tricarboxylate transporter TctB family protein [Methylorubrum salsuginis]SFL26775.1 Tripartite tricarboxylate transporter TctB family protein [Methylorubrum salsuginis]
MDAPLDGTSARRGPVRAPQSLVAGLGLIGLGLFGVWASSDLDYGSLRAIGPGLMPFWLSVGVGICGLALAVAGFTHDGHPLQSVSLRGPLVITLAVLAFAVTIRPFALGGVSTPGLGLIVAGPLAIVIAGYAGTEARFLELLTLALFLTAGCMLLFGDMLNLPIPIFPTAVVQAMTGVLPARTLLRIAAGVMALVGSGLLLVQRRSSRREPIEVARHSLTT